MAYAERAVLRSKKGASAGVHGSCNPWRGGISRAVDPL
jgi:hypothetical protein